MYSTTIKKSFYHKYQVGDTVFWYASYGKEGPRETTVEAISFEEEDYENSCVIYNCADGGVSKEKELFETKQEAINYGLSILDKFIERLEIVKKSLQDRIESNQQEIYRIQQRKQDLIAQIP